MIEVGDPVYDPTKPGKIMQTVKGRSDSVEIVTFLDYSGYQVKDKMFHFMSDARDYARSLVI